MNISGVNSIGIGSGPAAHAVASGSNLQNTAATAATGPKAAGSTTSTSSLSTLTFVDTPKGLDASSLGRLGNVALAFWILQSLMGGNQSKDENSSQSVKDMMMGLGLASLLSNDNSHRVSFFASHQTSETTGSSILNQANAVTAYSDNVDIKAASASPTGNQANSTTVSPTPSINVQA